MLPPRYDIAHVRLPLRVPAANVPSGTMGARRGHGWAARRKAQVIVLVKALVKAWRGHGGGRFDDTTGGDSAGLAGS